MTGLKDTRCVPCEGGAPTVTDREIEELRPQVPDWSIIKEDGERRLRRTFEFENFKQALDFTVKVGMAAEEQNHHPVLVTEWGRVTVIWWTHKIGGLHRNDFVMAARTDAIRGTE